MRSGGRGSVEGEEGGTEQVGRGRGGRGGHVDLGGEGREGLAPVWLGGSGGRARSVANALFFRSANKLAALWVGAFNW